MKCARYLFLLSVLLFSCARETIKHKVHFSGHVEDMYTHYPVKNAIITIRTHFFYNAGPSDDRVTDELGRTDENGNFDFDAKGMVKDKNATERYMFFHGCGVSDFANSGRWEINPIDSRENVLDVKLFAEARVCFIFQNSSPYDANDLVNNVYVERPWGQQKFAEGDPVFSGTNVDSAIWTSTYGYTTSVLHYTVTKNNISQNFTDTIRTSDPCDYGYWIRDTIQY